MKKPKSDSVKSSKIKGEAQNFFAFDQLTGTQSLAIP
jgi:hypothetical protein